MKYTAIPYQNIIDGYHDVSEKPENVPHEHDQHINEDITRLFEIRDLNNQIDNFFEAKKNKIESLKQKLNYSYNDAGERNDHAYRQKYAKDVQQNMVWKKEIYLVTEKQQIESLVDIEKSGCIIDQLKILDDDGEQITYLSTNLFKVNNAYHKDEESFVVIYPEFVLNATGSIQQPENDKEPLWEISLSQIKEIILNETRYIFGI